MRHHQSMPGVLLHAATASAGVAAAILGAAPAALAQDADNAADEGLGPIEVTAGAPAPGAPLFQAAQIDVLAGRDKEERETATLGETLEHLPGVRVIGAGNQVGKPVIRGLSGNRVRILSDGIAVDHQQFGTRHSPNIDPFLSERIEVVRGASSILYGSDALGGAIDVQALPLEFSDAGERIGRGQALLGHATNNDQVDAGVKGTSVGPHWTVAGGVVRRDGGDRTVPDDDVFFPPPPSDPGKRDAPAYTGTLPFTDFDQLNGQLGVGYRGDFGELRVRYTGWRNEHNFLLPPPAGNLPPGQGPEGIGQNLENDEVQLDLTVPVGTGWTLQPTVAWQRNLRQSNTAGAPRGELFDGTIELEFEQYTARLEARHEALGPFDAGTLGVDVRSKEQFSRGTTQLSPGGTVENIGVFAFEERTLGRLTVQAGLRHDFIETVGDAGRTRAATTFGDRDRNDYSVTSGSLGGAFALTDRLTLAANVGRGFRAPTLFELYADGVHAGVAAVQQGNADLDPEKSLNTDLSLRWRSPRVRASATVYRNAIDEYIFLADTGASQGGLPVFAYRQDDATLTGIELAVRGDVTESIEVSATYDAVDGENDATREELPLQPADEFRLETTWRPSGWAWLASPYVRFGVRHNAAKDASPGEPFAQFDNAPFGTASTDAYTVADVAFGFALGRSGNDAARFDLTIRNVTDETYRDFLDTYKGYALSPGRDVRLELRVPFGA